MYLIVEFFLYIINSYLSEQAVSPIVRDIVKEFTTRNSGPQLLRRNLATVYFKIGRDSIFYWKKKKRRDNTLFSFCFTAQLVNAKGEIVPPELNGPYFAYLHGSSLRMMNDHYDRSDPRLTQSIMGLELIKQNIMLHRRKSTGNICNNL